MRKKRKFGEVRHIEVESNKEKGMDMDKVMIDNFVSLQRVLTNLAVKTDALNDKISKLLDIFEISAKALSEKNFESVAKIDDKEILAKLELLLEQNRTIAKSLAMMHEEKFPPLRAEEGQFRESQMQREEMSPERSFQGQRFKQWPRY